MKVLVFVSMALGAAAAPASDPVAECRAAHADDPPAHIACLERALRAGAEELGAKPPEERVREVVVEIVAASYASGFGVFELADGQVWRETEKTPEQLRLKSGTRYRARIERGTVGGYRMYIDGVRRMIKVKRVK
jgi:hypothetical protein